MGFLGNIDGKVHDLGYMDALSRQETAIHRLDPRAKLLTTLLFVGTVVSFDRYALSAMVPFLIYPLFLGAAGRIPARYILRKILLVSPFAVLLGIFNPLLDRETALILGGVPLSGGWVSFLSILLRFVLTVGAALTLIAVTGFNAVCVGLRRLGVPRVLVVQLLFLHRYLFVLTDEAMRMMRARALRSFGRQGRGIVSWGSLVGHLGLRTLDRAQRIHLAMRSRGFNGEVRWSTEGHWGWSESVFLAGWVLFLLVGRMVNLSQALGELVRGGWGV
ncbi:MAG: cobalt ECF transporter T component CbiQ [Pseudomonadota bacterium]